MKQKVFRVSIIKYLLLMFVMYLLYAAGLLYGLSVYRKIPSFDPMKMTYLYALIGSGVILLAASITTLCLNISKRITIMPHALEFKHGYRLFTIVWRDLIFRPPENDRAIFRTAMVSNGREFGTFDNLFFKDFDFMLEIIGMARESKAGKAPEL